MHSNYKFETDFNELWRIEVEFDNGGFSNWCYNPKNEVGLMLYIHPDDPDIDGDFLKIYAIPKDKKAEYFNKLDNFAKQFNKQKRVFIWGEILPYIPKFDGILITDNSG